MSSVSTLDFNDIKTKIITYLKQDPYYKNFNFEAANISRFINLLAYNTLYNGYYTKMLMDESFIDSAKTMQAMISHANTHNYLVKLMSASRAMITIKVPAIKVADDVGYILIPSGTSFTSYNVDGAQVYFTSLYDVNLYKVNDYFVSESFVVIQGTPQVVTYEVLDKNKKYVINDSFADETTISIKVLPNKNAHTFIGYKRAYDTYNTNNTSRVYYLTTNSNQYYQIHFGQDLFGREPNIGEYIEVSYIKTDGTSGNNTNAFKVVLSKTDDAESNNINFYTSDSVEVITEEPASGGLDIQDIEELRYAIPNHNRVLYRVITPEDIKSVIISEFRDVESINVWSGGASKYRMYGKTYICIKPKTGDLLTNASKQKIIDILTSRYGVLSKTDLLFIDPIFININLSIMYKINQNIANETSSAITKKLYENIELYNKDVLCKFESNYYEADLIYNIKDKIESIQSININKTLSITINISFLKGKLEIVFGNAIKNISSEVFNYGNLLCYIKNKNNDVYILSDNEIEIVKIGTINLETGFLDIEIPRDVNTKTLKFIADPVYQDIYTQENNLVRIKDVTVNTMRG